MLIDKRELRRHFPVTSDTMASVTFHRNHKGVHGVGTVLFSDIKNLDGVNSIPMMFHKVWHIWNDLRSGITHEGMVLLNGCGNAGLIGQLASLFKREAASIQSPGVRRSAAKPDHCKDHHANHYKKPIPHV